MGTINNLKAELICQFCGQNYEHLLQFKFGTVDLRTYEVGEVILWDAPLKVGKPGLKKVAIDGCSVQACPHCGRMAEPEDFSILVERDTIVSVKQNQGEFPLDQDTWWVIEE